MKQCFLLSILAICGPVVRWRLFRQCRRLAGRFSAGRPFCLPCLLAVAATTMGLPPAAEGEPPTAIPTTAFLNSVGIDSTFPDRGQPLDKTVEMIKYVGFRWVRGGIEGLKDKGPTTIQTYLDLHQETGVRFSWSLGSGGADLKKLTDTAGKLATADALLAFEGNNEPNNGGVTYQGEKGGGQAPSWLAVAKL
jgi:hypothetical protein